MMMENDFMQGLLSVPREDVASRGPQTGSPEMGPSTPLTSRCPCDLPPSLPPPQLYSSSPYRSGKSELGC